MEKYIMSYSLTYEGDTMKRTSDYETLYRKNPKTGRIIIDVALDNYLDFFHEWDSSAFKKRDMHPDLAEFLDLCSEEIPLRRKLEIAFTLEADEVDDKKEELIRISYRNYYNSLKRFEKKRLERYIRFSTILLLISFVLLATYATLSKAGEGTIISNVFRESLLIGGWVFAWETIHLLFIDTLEPINRYREINRFLEADISFKYKGLK